MHIDNYSVFQDIATTYFNYNLFNFIIVRQTYDLFNN